MLFQFVVGFFLSALQSYDGFSHGGNICVFFTCYPCDKRVKMRQMGEKALKSVAKVALGKQKYDLCIGVWVCFQIKRWSIYCFAVANHVENVPRSRRGLLLMQTFKYASYYNGSWFSACDFIVERVDDLECLAIPNLRMLTFGYKHLFDAHSRVVARKNRQFLIISTWDMAWGTEPLLKARWEQQPLGSLGVVDIISSSCRGCASLHHLPMVVPALRASLHNRLPY